MDVQNLNFHHLRYFHDVAHDGNLTRTAERLNVSQSALSTQIKTLEARLGHALFDRVGRQLVLTEVGRIVLDHADRIFATGQELVDTLQRTSDTIPPLRVGALSTLSRNFQMNFLRGLLANTHSDVVLKSGDEHVLFEALKALSLDVVLTTEPPPLGFGDDYTAHRIDAQDVGLHGSSARLQHDTLAALLAAEPIILPTERTIRMGFESLCARLDVQPRIVAEVDDMAMVRVLAREDIGVAVAPAVVLADEIATGRLATAPFDLDIVEAFYAVTVKRSFPHPLLAGLMV